MSSLINIKPTKICRNKTFFFFLMTEIFKSKKINGFIWEEGGEKYWKEIEA